MQIDVIACDHFRWSHWSTPWTCWKTCLGSMIRINTWHPLTSWQCKHMLRVARALLPLDYLSNAAQSFFSHLALRPVIASWKRFALFALPSPSSRFPTFEFPLVDSHFWIPSFRNPTFEILNVHLPNSHLNILFPLAVHASIFQLSFRKYALANLTI